MDFAPEDILYLNALPPRLRNGQGDDIGTAEELFLGNELEGLVTGLVHGAAGTGDHVHLNSAFGTYQGFYTVSSGKRQLVNSSHIYNTFYTNDTVIREGYGYNWREYSGGHTPDYRQYKFKWVLYANKLRNRNMT